jgi:hypothetical protein
VKPLFVDTAGWMACADGADPFHGPAVAARDGALEAGRLLLTTDYVADETLTLLRMRLGLPAAEEWWRQVEASPRLRWEAVDGDRAGRARTAFFGHGDKRWSFTDCTSLVVMRELGLREVLTTDGNFRQMGFETLPREAAARGGPAPRRPTAPSSGTSSRGRRRRS